MKKKATIKQKTLNEVIRDINTQNELIKKQIQASKQVKNG